MSSDVTVVGAGALGLCTALELARRGLRVDLFDPQHGEANASGIAAGMLAPALESLLDGRPEDLPLLMAARDRWPEQAQALGAPSLLDRSGAMWVGEAAEEKHGWLRSQNLQAELLPAEEARARQPLLGTRNPVAFTAEDWRLDGPATLRRLRAAFVSAGGRICERAALAGDATRRPVVVAAGPGASAFAPIAPELAVLGPIKGQLVRLQVEGAAGPVIRAEGVYIAPGDQGVTVGATMEPGRCDLELEAETLAALQARAAVIAPSLANAPGVGAAGVRMTTPDGLPLAGPSSVEGVFLATGARRNGWLLAPLVGRMVAAYLTGDDPGPYASRLDPRRFGR